MYGGGTGAMGRAGVEESVCGGGLSEEGGYIMDLDSGKGLWLQA